MKCNGVRKEDDGVTVCVLCTLSFLKADDYHQILLLPFVLLSLHFGFLGKCVIPDLSLDCKYLNDGGLALTASFIIIFCCSFPHLLPFYPKVPIVLLMFSIACNIVQSRSRCAFNTPD